MRQPDNNPTPSIARLESDMFSIRRQDVHKIYNEVLNDIRDYKGEGVYGFGAANPAMYERANGMRLMLHRLFGSKCLPDDGDKLSPEKPAEPKVKVGDKVLYKGVVRVIGFTDSESHKCQLMSGDYYAEWAEESDLEPYTDPTEEASPNVNHSDIDIAELVAKGCVPDPAKQFDTILKDGFCNERRLNIAAMITAGIYSNDKAASQFNSIEALVGKALDITDTLIAECEKGGKS